MCAGAAGNNDNSESLEHPNSSAGNGLGEAEEKHHPHFDRALMRSRRKSVSFAVCKVNKDTMQFDIEHKSVLLNKRGSGSGGVPGSSKGGRDSPLKDVAKKWKAAKNKLVLKDRLSSLLGNKNDEFEDAETFRIKRQELMEKAKALENSSKKSDKNDESNV